MRSLRFFLPTIAVAGFGEVTAAHKMPEMTAPALLPMIDNQISWMQTPPLKPGDEDYVDESDAAWLAKRSPPAGVYLCDEEDWKGHCGWKAVDEYKCQDFDAYDVAVSFGVSIEPDRPQS